MLQRLRQAAVDGSLGFLRVDGRTPTPTLTPTLPSLTLPTPTTTTQTH